MVKSKRQRTLSRDLDFYSTAETQHVLRTLPRPIRNLVPGNARIRCSGCNSQFHDIYLGLYTDTTFPPRYHILVWRRIHDRGMAYKVSLSDGSVPVGKPYVMSMRRHEMFVSALDNLK